MLLMSWLDAHQTPTESWPTAKEAENDENLKPYGANPFLSARVYARSEYSMRLQPRQSH